MHFTAEVFHSLAYCPFKTTSLLIIGRRIFFLYTFGYLFREEDTNLILLLNMNLNPKENTEKKLIINPKFACTPNSGKLYSLKIHSKVGQKDIINFRNVDFCAD